MQAEVEDGMGISRGADWSGHLNLGTAGMNPQPLNGDSVPGSSTSDDDISAARNHSTSLRRALAIVAYIADRGPGSSGVGPSELGRELGMHKATVLRLLIPLCEFRLVERNRSGTHYQLGSGAARLGYIYLEGLDLRKVARDSLVELSEAFGETVYLAMFDAPAVVYIDKIESPQSIRLHAQIGARQPAYSTGVGKAYLAHAPEHELRKVLDAGLSRRTENTLTSEEHLRADLERIRLRGYAIDDVENEPDVRCVAAPIYDVTGAVHAAVSIAGPAGRVTLARADELGRSVANAGREISRRLGAAPGATVTFRDTKAAQS